MLEKFIPVFIGVKPLNCFEALLTDQNLAFLLRALGQTLLLRPPTVGTTGEVGDFSFGGKGLGSVLCGVVKVAELRAAGPIIADRAFHFDRQPLKYQNIKDVSFECLMGPGVDKWVSLPVPSASPPHTFLCPSFTCILATREQGVVDFGVAQWSLTRRSLEGCHHHDDTW